MIILRTKYERAKKRRHWLQKRPGNRENGCRGVCCLFNIQDCFGFTKRVSAMVNTSGTPL